MSGDLRYGLRAYQRKRKASSGDLRYPNIGTAWSNPAKRARTGYSTVPRTRGVYAKGEMKYYDTERAVVAISSSADWTGTEYDPNTTNEASPVSNPLGLFQPKVGSGINQRIGKSCKLMSLKIRGAVTCAKQGDQTATDNPTIVRIALVWDQQTNSSQCQGEQVFTDPTTAAASMAIHAYQNIDNFGRFRVLKDKMLTIQNPNAAYDGTNVEQQGLTRLFKMNIKFGKEGIPVRFNATNGGTVADVVDNSFHIIANANDTDLVPTITYYCRACYKE